MTGGTELKLMTLPASVTAGFLREWLPEAPSLFGGLAGLDLESGDAFAWLPATAIAATITNLNWGGVVSRESAARSREAARDYADRHAGVGSDLCLIALDPLGSAGGGDGEAGSGRAPSLESGGWVYLRSFRGATGWISPSDVLKEIGMTYPLIAVLCSEPVADWLWQTRASSSDAMERLAEQTRCIVFGAFDGESYAVWLPAGSPPPGPNEPTAEGGELGTD